jgi:hypothetical protein
MKNARSVLGEFTTCAHFSLFGSTFLVVFVTISKIRLFRKTDVPSGVQGVMGVCSSVVL